MADSLSSAQSITKSNFILNCEVPYELPPYGNDQQQLS